MDKAEKTTSNAIQTERLDMVPSVEPHDLDRYLSDLLSANDFYFQYGEPYSAELLEAIDFHSTDVVYYSIFLKNTQTMIGYIGILPYKNDPEYGEIEFYIFHDYRRQGFCKEAMTAYIDCFFTGSLTGVRGKQVVAETLMENEAVMKLLENTGFERESWGMRLSLIVGGKINRDDTIAGLRRYIINADT